MELTISLIGILAAMAVLILLMMRGVNLFITVMAASLVVMLTSGLNIHETLVGTYISGLVGYFQSYFFMFLWGSLLGIFMEVSGGATAIAHWLIRIMKDKAYLSIPIATGLLAYGGVFAIAATFPIIPIARAIFKQNNIARRLMPGALYFGACTFAMVAPGAVQVQNIVPTQGFQVSLMAGTVGGFAGAGAMLIVGSLWLRAMIKKAAKNGEVFVDRDTDIEPDTSHLPHPLLACLPLIVTIVVINLGDGAGNNLFPVETAIFIGDVSALVFLFKYYNWKEILNYLAKGVSNTSSTVFNISTIVGFGSVIKATAGFSFLVDLCVSIPGPYLIGIAIGTTIICGVCGSASGGLGIATPIFTEVYFNLPGVSHAAIARIMALASSALDSSPHSGAVTSIINMCGETHKDAYLPVFNLSVVTPAIGTIVGIIVFSLFPMLP